jgi:hypothetical protein
MVKQQTKSTTYFSINVLIHVIILFTFLSTFFFLYISKVEENAFKNELGGMIETSLMKILLENPTSKEDIKNSSEVLTQLSKLYATPDAFTQERNTLVKFSAVFTLLIIVGILITVLATLSAGCDRDVSIKHILIENVIVFLCVGMVEYMFFTKIAIKYVPTSPSLLTNTLISTIKSQLS